MATFRSNLEKKFHELTKGIFEYEPFKVDYIVHHKYTPDFVRGDVYIEVKGFFRMGDTLKYKSIAKCLKEQGKELVFFLESPNKRVRKGSRLSMAEWCQNNNIKWFGFHNLEELSRYVK